MQCFIRPVARVGSGDPVRVLRLYTTNTLDEVCSIYCWDICTTCRYRSTCYSTGTSGPTALSVCSQLCLSGFWPPTSDLVLYCTMPFIATCVDAIGTVFWDRPVLRYPGKALILVAKLLLFTLVDTQVFELVNLLYFQWGSLGPLRMVGKLKRLRAWLWWGYPTWRFKLLCNAISMRSTISILWLWGICLSSFFSCRQVLFIVSSLLVSSTTLSFFVLGSHFVLEIY